MINLYEIASQTYLRGYHYIFTYSKKLPNPETLSDASNPIAYYFFVSKYIFRISSALPISFRGVFCGHNHFESWSQHRLFIYCTASIQAMFHIWNARRINLLQGEIFLIVRFRRNS